MAFQQAHDGHSPVCRLHPATVTELSGPTGYPFGQFRVGVPDDTLVGYEAFGCLAFVTDSRVPRGTVVMV